MSPGVTLSIFHGLMCLAGWSLRQGGSSVSHVHHRDGLVVRQQELVSVCHVLFDALNVSVYCALQFAAGAVDFVFLHVFFTVIVFLFIGRPQQSLCCSHHHQPFS